MVMEKMIILYKNHKCGIDDPNNLEKYRDDTSVYKILLPVNLYAPEYVLLDPETLPRKFKQFKFEYTLTLENYSDAGYFCRDCDTQTVTCNNITELIRFVLSIYKIRRFNLINNQNEFEDYSNYILENMKVLRIGKKRSEFWDLKRECMSENYSEIATILDILNYLVNKNSEKDIIPPVDTRDTIFINSKKGKWSTNRGDKHDLRSLALMNFNTITFISEEDYEMLENVDSCIFSQIPFIVFDDMNIPYEHIDSTILYEELDMEYVEIFADTETCIYDVAELVEILINLRHIKLCKCIMDEVAYGILGEDHIHELRFSLKHDPNKKKDSARPVYKFALRDRENGDKDHYDDFMIFLAGRMIKC